MEIWGLQVTFRATSAPSVPVKTWSFKELDPHTSCTVLSPGSLSTHCLISESTADLNNMEATQIEVKLEVAGRWTGHNTGTELSSCVYFIPSKTPATDGDAGNSVFGEWVLNTVEKQLYQKVPLHLAPKSPISKPWKPMSWEILSPGIVTETRHTKSTMASELWYWSKVKPAFSSWLVTNPLCGLSQVINFSRPWFPHCKVSGFDIMILAEGFFPASNILFLWWLYKKVYFWNSHVKIKPISSSC